jgi:predicted  nucleic acid-binding Zn-ribbon protein
MLLDVDDQDEHDSVATRKILLSARHEMHNAKADVNALQEAYSQLEHTHHRDLAEAQRLLAAAEKSRAEEHQGSEQAMAELRALAAEIHRLASEADIVGGSDPALLSEVASLGTELASTDPSTLAYLAEDVLIRMVSRLRQLVDAPEDVGPLREELAKARVELAQAGATAAERDALKLQYQEQCRSAERSTAQARDREHRLRSMVTAPPGGDGRPAERAAQRADPGRDHGA